ncbi:hypothetical protein [Salinimicrobium sp. GXAS 041]
MDKVFKWIKERYQGAYSEVGYQSREEKRKQERTMKRNRKYAKAPRVIQY